MNLAHDVLFHLAFYRSPLNEDVFATRIKRTNSQTSLAGKVRGFLKRRHPQNCALCWRSPSEVALQEHTVRREGSLPSHLRQFCFSLCFCGLSSVRCFPYSG